MTEPSEKRGNDQLWVRKTFNTHSLSEKNGKAYVALDEFRTEANGTSQENTRTQDEEAEDNQNDNQERTEVKRINGNTEMIDENLVEELLENSQGTTHAGSETTSQSQQNRISLTDDQVQIGHVSSGWKKAGACLFFGSITFLIGVGIVFTLALLQSNILLYLLSFLTLLYGAFRLGISYYIYVDAKLLRYHTEQQKNISNNAYGWKARPLFWAAFIFFLPPFVQYAPMVMYLYRRHRFTGVP